ncbi:PGN_0703 family putative restriction endonuclease [Heyndrickxia acidicola]
MVNKEEGTNFDFYFKFNSGKEIFFEIKYMEDKFGKVK